MRQEDTNGLKESFCFKHVLGVWTWKWKIIEFAFTSNVLLLNAARLYTVIVHIKDVLCEYYLYAYILLLLGHWFFVCFKFRVLLGCLRTGLKLTVFLSQPPMYLGLQAWITIPSCTRLHLRLRPFTFYYYLKKCLGPGRIQIWPN